jgi:hypothetical protein
MKHPAIAIAAAAAPLAIAAVLTGAAMTASISTATAWHQPVEATAHYFIGATNSKAAGSFIGAIQHATDTNLGCFAPASATIQKAVC